MPIGKDYRLTIGAGREALPPGEDREGATTADLSPEPAAVYESLKLIPGAEEIIKEIPGLGDFVAWVPTAYFSVCTKTGTAYYLDLWNADHFDGFTDMAKCLADCRAWFAGDGFTTWGSDQTKTGRVNCYFNAPTAGHYICTAALQSYPTSSGAQVECLIDNSSFGPLPFSGTIYQPHPCDLSAGGHHFRIRQMSGSFFFLSLTVWKV
jgi:hypothetical protein